MKNSVLIFLLSLIIFSTTYGQDCIRLEKLAFNFFLDEIKFDDDTKFIFDGKISDEYTDFNNFDMCFEYDSVIYTDVKIKAYHLNKYGGENKNCGLIEINSDNINRFVKKKKKKLDHRCIEVRRAVSLDTISFVEIRSTYKHYVDIYYFKIDQQDKISWCKTGFVY